MVVYRNTHLRKGVEVEEALGKAPPEPMSDKEGDEGNTESRKLKKNNSHPDSPDKKRAQAGGVRPEAMAVLSG